MAKNNMKKPNKNRRRKGSGFDTVKLLALIVFIVMGIGIVGGTVWYYAIFQPRAAEDLESSAISFTEEFFNVSHTDITGQEGAEWMTDTLAQETASSDRVSAWKESKLVSRVDGDVEVKILDQGWRTGTARAIFWHYEEVEEEGKEYLVYYDYEFSYVGGDWLVSKVHAAEEEALKDLRRTRGVYDQHYGDDQEDEDSEGGETE